ncbi:MAG: carboxypeptidase regulatory-like domain-containing protein [Alphaproteobacteria bacterium]|nr:carboxypeptidase regulatory-like domain-containing protein [Alphaproteobacteria bacterium]
MTRSSLALSASFAALLWAAPALAQPGTDISGQVTGARGPEAGVWVIAETRDLPTKYVKIVVTDDSGRYLLPDLPKASYDIWVRGYGLIDSPKVKSAPGKQLDLKAVAAPTETAAAQYYPAVYWWSLLKIPEAKLFPGSGASGNGMPVSLRDQGQWLRFLKTDGCNACHQLGDRATRELEPQLGHFDSSAAAWERRIQSGQPGALMVNAIGDLDPSRALSLFGDWTDRIAKGELPFAKPSRPSGIERNLVLTLWDWSTPTSYMHDLTSTDKRNPSLNPDGIIYGSPELSSDYVAWLDPVNSKTGLIKTEWRDPKTPTTKSAPIYAPSPYWANQPVWDSHSINHNPMMDDQGRIWLTSRIRPAANPAFCKKGSHLPSAENFPLDQSTRQLQMYDPKTKKITTFDLCFTTHHLNFDNNGVIWFSSGSPTDPVIGWFDTKKWDATHDEQASQGWAPFIVDVNGNGKVDDYVEPNQPADPRKDKRVLQGLYSVSANPVDGSIWAVVLGFPGTALRFDPKTKLTEFYQVPWNDPKNPDSGFSPRGADVTSDGVLWAVLASGHLASFDRRLCKGPLTGPVAASGKACPEGWKLHTIPAPQFRGVAMKGGSAEAPYYDWVDRFDTLGLGKDVPIATGNLSDALFAYSGGKFVTLRVPYPMGFFAKGMDGRIDDAKAGWKGKGIWATFSGSASTHIEGGKGQTPKVIHFQLRPTPTAS